MELSFTVRNVLADLETAGLLTHPHTSAGRIPTDRLATHQTSLDEVPNAMPAWAHDRTGLIKAIVTV